MKVSVFYSRMASYFWDCMKHASESYGIEFDVVMHRPSEDAPLQFADTNSIRVRYRDEVSDSELSQDVHSASTAAVLVSGWMDNGYLRAIRRASTPTVCMVDNPYRGTLRQRFASVFVPTVRKQYFSHAWVAGRSTYELVRRLGFSEQDILSGVYSINDSKYRRCHPKQVASNRPRKLIYIGRFLDWKGIIDLADAFQEVVANDAPDWELHYYGRGDCRPEIEARATDSVVVNDFVQPSALPALLHEAEAVCVPSWDEHWGVVVHEAAMAGAPLICSDRVRAAEEFLIDGFNGWTFKAKCQSSLCKALTELTATSQESLALMSRRSELLARRHTVENWSAKLWSLIRPQVSSPVTPR